jgi:hypothetical protein
MNADLSLRFHKNDEMRYFDEAPMLRGNGHGLLRIHETSSLPG